MVAGDPGGAFPGEILLLLLRTPFGVGLPPPFFRAGRTKKRKLTCEKDTPPSLIFCLLFLGSGGGGGDQKGCARQSNCVPPSFPPPASSWRLAGTPFFISLGETAFVSPLLFCWQFRLTSSGGWRSLSFLLDFSSRPIPLIWAISLFLQKVPQLPLLFCKPSFCLPPLRYGAQRPISIF